MKRINRGSRAAIASTGDERMDSLLVLIDDVEKVVFDDADDLALYDVLGEMEKIIREEAKERERRDGTECRRLQDTVADYLRGLADDDDLRRVLSENSNVAIPA